MICPQKEYIPCGGPQDTTTLGAAVHSLNFAVTVCRRHIESRRAKPGAAYHFLTPELQFGCRSLDPALDVLVTDMMDWINMTTLHWSLLDTPFFNQTVNRGELTTVQMYLDDLLGRLAELRRVDFMRHQALIDDSCTRRLILASSANALSLLHHVGLVAEPENGLEPTGLAELVAFRERDGL